VELRPYHLRCDGAWHIDLHSVDAASRASGARALVLVQPHHPTGLCADAATLAALEELCAARGMALVSDEVFGDFPWPPEAHAPPSLLDGERRVPAFVLSGLSKVCGMPQLKLGWIALAGPSGERARARAGLEWLADLFLSVGSAVQQALPRLLEAGPAYRARVLARIEANLDALAQFLAAHRDVDLRSAHAGWVALLRLPARRSDLDWALAFLERGVAVHPGHFYDLEESAHVVASLIVEPATFAPALERMGERLHEA
jgi:aspartate/methionine/tyrosine aminotransferase